MKKTALSMGTATVLVALSAAAPAFADGTGWPVKVYDRSTGHNVATDYSPVGKASKPWNVCVLVPHMKDTFWVAVDYGFVEQARQEGINITVYQAGGYENLPKQIAQFDDCLASNFDAIVIGVISEAGLAKEIEKAKAAGKPVITTANPVSDKAPVTAKMDSSFVTMGEQSGHYLVDYLKGKDAKIVTFPGPAGSGWAEAVLEGFKKATAGHKNISILDDKFGDSGVAVQLGLVQNALQAYPDMNVIWGCAPAVEASIGAVGEAGRNGILIESSYENQAMLDALKTGNILGFATQYPVLYGRIAIDTAVRVLEKKPFLRHVQTIPDMVGKGSLDKLDMSEVLAPADFKAVFSVTAP